MGMYSTLAFIWKHPLNRNARLAAVGRFARWQLASRAIRTDIALPFVNDTFLFARQHMYGATGNWYCGLHEYRDMGFVLHMLRPGDLFLDIGANIGSYAVLAAGACRANVMAVEPIPSTFALLQRDIELNHIGHLVDARCLGVSNRAGSLRFTSDLDTVNHVATSGENQSTVEVKVETVDSLCAEVVPVVIKIDVEGHEQAVLAGASKTLGNPSLKAVIMEVNGSGQRYGLADDDLCKTMIATGFSAHTYDPVNRQLAPIAAADGNVIFLREPELIRRRTRQAPRFRLVNGDI